MSEIKLPVTVYKVDQEAWNCEFLRIIDAEGRDLTKDQVAAALNAAPKRAFEELTADGVGLILQNVLIEIGEPPDNGAERQEWLKRHDATVLAHLQAFAAPVAPAWQPIAEEAVKGKGYLLLRPIADLKAQAPVVAKFGYSAIEGDPEWQQDGGISYAFHCFDGWQPLPAAPEAQGGAEDA